MAVGALNQFRTINYKFDLPINTHLKSWKIKEK
jgi:hypothetical protein